MSCNSDPKFWDSWNLDSLVGGGPANLRFFEPQILHKFGISELARYLFRLFLLRMIIDPYSTLYSRSTKNFRLYLMAYTPLNFGKFVDFEGTPQNLMVLEHHPNVPVIFRGGW